MKVGVLKDYNWGIQLVERKNKKGRVREGMTIGIKQELINRGERIKVGTEVIIVGMAKVQRNGGQLELKCKRRCGGKIKEFEIKREKKRKLKNLKWMKEKEKRRLILRKF